MGYSQKAEYKNAINEYKKAKKALSWTLSDSSEKSRIDDLISSVYRAMPSPTSFLTPSPIPTAKIISQQSVNMTPKINCVGPDGVHFQTTQIECNNFNNAWKGIKPQPTTNPNAWGVASQLNEHTWTMQIGSDKKMTTPQELYEALNNYRRVHGRSTLGWNDNLAKFAQSRAEDQAKSGKTDEHAGFMSYVDNPDNLRSLGFWSVGENSSYGFILSGVHFIEWIYAGDKPHDDNQLDSSWTNVGVGVSGTVTDIIFGHN